MLEATIPQGALLKKLIDCVKEVVSAGNWECNESGIALESMDSSHVALVSLLLRADGFQPYRCDRNMTLGINVESMAKILKCAGNDDQITLSAQDSGEALTFTFNGKNERVSEYELKLMDIDAEQLGVPDTEYPASVELSSAEFQRICRDLGSIGENLKIMVAKDTVKFGIEGELGNGSVILRQTASVDDEDNSVTVNIDHAITLDFAVKYLQIFSKAASLSPRVTLYLSNEVPMLVEYKINDLGYLRYYVAPKINEDEETMDAMETKVEDDY